MVASIWDDSVSVVSDEEFIQCKGPSENHGSRVGLNRYHGDCVRESRGGLLPDL